ncbi:MAG: hypothetical protein IPN69_18855 [Acidobacteria bacterium]|nr:hypothetical protein [Acidobacteriota bacterium]
MNFRHARVVWIPIVLTVASLALTSCSAWNSNVESNVQNSLSERELQNMPEPTSKPQMQEKTAEKTDKQLHDDRYRANLKIISVLNQLTELDAQFLEAPISDVGQESRKRKVKALVRSFDGDPASLIMLAKLCRFFKKVGRDNDFAAAPVYDIAFFESIILVSRGDASSLDELMGLKDSLGDSEFGDFQRAMKGNEPIDLYGIEK